MTDPSAEAFLLLLLSFFSLYLSVHALRYNFKHNKGGEDYWPNILFVTALLPLVAVIIKG